MHGEYGGGRVAAVGTARRDSRGARGEPRGSSSGGAKSVGGASAEETVRRHEADGEQAEHSGGAGAELERLLEAAQRVALRQAVVLDRRLYEALVVPRRVVLSCRCGVVSWCRGVVSRWSVVVAVTRVAARSGGRPDSRRYRRVRRRAAARGFG